HRKLTSFSSPMVERLSPRLVGRHIAGYHSNKFVQAEILNLSRYLNVGCAIFSRARKADIRGLKYCGRLAVFGQQSANKIKAAHYRAQADLARHIRPV